jgi:hypothetical protein
MGTLEQQTPKTPIRISGSVGAGGDNAPADVIAVEMHLNAFIAAGALKGVSQALFTIGAMNDAFIKAIKAFQRDVVGMSKPDGRVDPNGKTLKYLNGPISARGGKVKPGPLEPPRDVQAARERIADTARHYLREGGHFLMGAMGDTPGRADGHPGRVSFTNPATFMEESHPSKLGPAVNAAWASTGRFGLLGCMGRPTKLRVPNKGKLEEKDPRTRLLRPYMACIRRMKALGIPHVNWPGFDVYEAHSAAFDGARTIEDFTRLTGRHGTGKLFPRRIQPGGAIHLGESCVTHRHYDCIGFVNFVLSKVLRPMWAQSMEYYVTPSSQKPFEIMKLGDKEEVFKRAEVGDIVLKSLDEEKHSGICVPHGNGLVVTNCRSMDTGLINSKLEPEWSFLARLRRVV